MTAMEEITAKPPGLPRSTPTLSYWQQPPDSIADLKTTASLPGLADIVIIGSGISGVTIAYNLLTANPELSITMLEARQAASGASGRNGGHTKHASYRKFAEDISQSGLKDAIKIAQLEYDCMTAVHSFIREKSIDCDAVQCPTVDVYYDEDQFQHARKSVDLMKKHIGTTPVTDYTFHTPSETTQAFLTPNSVGSLTYAAGSLSAYKLTTGILKLALSLGLNLQTHTPALSLKKTQLQYPLWTVTTPRGEITAPKLILATNGYTPHLYPPLQGNIIPFRGIVTAHRPGSTMPPTGLSHTYSFVYAAGYDYMITRPPNSLHAGDIVIGGGLTLAPDGGIGEFGNTDDTTLSPAIEEYLTASTARFFDGNWGVDHPDGRVRHAWSGIMGYSADGYPLVGPVPGEEGIFVSASFQGHGMVLCFLCARAVSAMVLGREREEGVEEWFPGCFRVSAERVAMRFKGVEHVPDVGEEKDRKEEEVERIEKNGVV